jgi:NAD(P)-dependent dehydrogenase (short-subunit alcohol dehydrogenase family)
VSEIRLDGKVAIVTGSGRGLGRAYAKGLAAAGARVVVNDLDADSAAATVAQIAAAGGEAVSEVAAVGTSEAAERLVARAVSEFGRLDAMVTNAGVLRDRVLWKMGDEDFDLVIATHLRGTFTCARAAAIQMREQGEGGRIIVAGSPTGQRGTFGQTNYAAAKAGIVGLTRVMDIELSRYGIRVNALAPVARTGMTAVFDHGAVTHELEFPPPESVAPIVVYLAGEASRQLRGQVLSFDGTRLSVWSHPAAVSTWARPGGWTAGAFGDVLTPDAMEDTHPDHWGSGILGG